MTDGFGTTVEEMHRAARHVFAVNDAVQAELATLRGRLAPLSAAWRGEAVDRVRRPDEPLGRRRAAAERGAARHR